MDPSHFDDLVKRLATGTTRRNALKIFGGGIMAGTLGRLRSSTADAAPQGKVGICHLTGSASNPVVFITVSVNAIPAHEAHGDVIDPDFENDPANCGGCLISCDDGDPCTIDTCEGGVCVNTPVDCSDLDDQCLVGVCVDGVCEAQAANEGLACDDLDACTVGEVCTNGVCTGGSAANCDDGDPCTIDSCVSPTGCVHTDVICTAPEVCVDGDCVCLPGNTCDGDEDCCPDEECCQGTCTKSCGPGEALNPDTCQCQCANPFVCGANENICGSNPGGGTLDTCLCTATIEGGVGCGNNFFCGTTGDCDSNQDCIDAFGPGAFCQGGTATGCCGVGECVPPCGVTVSTLARQPQDAGTNAG